MIQRPLTGEPLALDLLNTRWRQGGRDIDLLAGLAGLAQWLGESGQDGGPVTEPVRSALVHARVAIRGVVEAVPGAEDLLNGVLARGLIVRTLRADRAFERVLFADEDWAPAWRAATAYLTLVDTASDGVRQCAGSECVLYFFDPPGRRRWCSMAGCGNRAKARRHLARLASAKGNRAPSDEASRELAHPAIAPPTRCASGDVAGPR